MISKTKYEASRNELEKVFEKAGLGILKEAEPLGEGEFNAAFLVETDKGRYVLKIAPPLDAVVMSYEKDMMKSEVFWYSQIRNHTTVKVPEVYFEDESRSLIPSHYFIMELLEGKPLCEMEFTEEEQRLAEDTKVRMAAQIHRIKSDRFGYIQTGTKDNWYEAIKGMVTMLLHDCEQLGKKSVSGKRLLSAINKHHKILENVEGTMVNFDLWDSNVFCRRTEEGLKFAWIDPERSFYGDPIADFVACGGGSKKLLSEKARFFKAYGSVSGITLTGDSSENIRYAVALGYLALIMEVERYNRYMPGDEGWERNTKEAEEMFEVAFGVLG